MSVSLSIEWGDGRSEEIWFASNPEPRKFWPGVARRRALRQLTGVLPLFVRPSNRAAVVVELEVMRSELLAELAAQPDQAVARDEAARVNARYGRVLEALRRMQRDPGAYAIIG